MEHDLRPDRGDAGSALAGTRVLIVEDQVEVAALLRAAVEDAGGQVLAVAATIDEAIAMVCSETISAAIITMIAGGLHTDRVARELLRRGIPFAVTTGIGTAPSHPELHAAPTVFKPFLASHVQEMVAQLLARRELNPDLTV